MTLIDKRAAVTTFAVQQLQMAAVLRLR